MFASLSGAGLGSVAVIVLIAACAQMVSGFGFALLAVPLMGLAIDLKTAVVISTICGTASNTYQAVVDGRHRDARLVRVLVISSLVGMPFGYALLDRVDVDVLQVVIGVVVLAALAVVVRKPSTRYENARLADVVAGFASGVLATATSTNGPPLVLLLRSKGLSPDQFRATINTVFSVVAFLTMAVFLASGRFTAEVVTGAAVAVPGLAAGVYLGARLRERVPIDVFWKIVATLLVVTATSSIISGLA